MSGDYKNVAHIYQAMVPEDTLKGLRTANPFMAKIIVGMDDNSYILDAACGCGWDVIAIKNGMLGLQDPPKIFNVSASDGSSYMIQQAKINIQNSLGISEIDEINIRQCMLADLNFQLDWKGRFDLVIVPNAINQLPSNVPYGLYDEYLLSSLDGIRSVLKDSSKLLIDTRDWGLTFTKRFTTTMRQNTYRDQTYLTEYVWRFGDELEGVHHALMTIWDNVNRHGPGHAEEIVFAAKTREKLVSLFNKAGFKVLAAEEQERGLNQEPFITFLLSIR